MADYPSINKPWRLILPQRLYTRLHDHLFPGDGDEHGAVIVAGIAETERGVRLLTRDLHLADERLVHLAIHNHGGRDHVAFSEEDLCSHERGYPALLDISNGIPVGALVFAENAIAGSIWLSPEHQLELAGASVIGHNLKVLHSAPVAGPKGRSPLYERQARLFGDAGQGVLGRAKVGIIGLGGAGSLLAEYLGRLGVGNLVLADPDRAALSNLPRLTGSTLWDALSWFAADAKPGWMRRLAARFAKTKVALARRNILRANPCAKINAIFGDFLEAEIASSFLDCDYLFLAADSVRARLLFNAIVHQYLIPGVQVGAKVQVDKTTGEVVDVFSVVRPVTSESGCLLCNRLINSAKLQEESMSEGERKGQRYVDEPEVVVPSVITLNAVAVSHAADDFLFYMTGLRDPNAPTGYMRFQPLSRRAWLDETRKSVGCPECGTGSKSRLARGDGRRLPVIERTRS